MKKKKRWIKSAIGKEGKGALHRNLDVPEGEKIPAEKMEEAAHSENPTIRRQAALAKTLKAMHKKPSASKMMAGMYGSKKK